MAPSFSFETLIQPIESEDFFQQFYERAPLRIRRNHPDFYHDLLTLDRLDAWLASGVPRYPDVMLVQHEIDIPASDYSDAEQRVDADRLYRRFADGATIVINHLERHVPALAALCRASERRFSMPFQTNVYLSPPNAQGFRTHYDSHDVFVLQVEGDKQWRLYDTKLALPLPGQSFERERDQPGALSDEFELTAGDLLYCPRGLMHDARSSAAPSLHITFGLLGKTWAELMIEAVAAACISEPELRRHLPVGFADPGFDRSVLRPVFAEMLQRMAQRGDAVDTAFDALVEGFVTSRRPALRGRLGDVLADDTIALDDMLAPRPDLIWRLEAVDDASGAAQGEDGQVRLLVAGCDISLPAFTRPAVAFMLTTPRFCVRDLPGAIDDDARLVLARRFLREGLLTRGVAAPAAGRTLA
jgi:ribosomal protein L16 Arg81 hydroxylase